MKDMYPDFLPQWTKAILYANRTRISMSRRDIADDIQKESGLNYCDSRVCLVGEAFFNRVDFHDCRTCDAYQYDAAAEAMESKDSLYLFKLMLAQHLRYEHPEVWQEWRDHF